MLGIWYTPASIGPLASLMWLVRSLESFGHIFNLRRRRKITTTTKKKQEALGKVTSIISPPQKKTSHFQTKKGRGHSPTLQKLLQQSGCSNGLTIGNFEPRISRLDDAFGIPRGTVTLTTLMDVDGFPLGGLTHRPHGLMITQGWDLSAWTRKN